jgi:hypothetical protein
MNDQPASAPQRGTGLAFVQHWNWVAEKGLMPKPTAMAIRAAASQILKIDEDWENVDVRHLDVGALIGRFRNLSKLAPGSLATYESRFRTGLESYLAYLNNPTSYQPRARKASTRDDKPSSTAKNLSLQQTNLGRPSTLSDTTVVGSSAKLVVYPFPVRLNVFAELKLPADLTLEEATRLGAFLKTLAVSDAGSADE